jgi:hypothetical protein
MKKEGPQASSEKGLDFNENLITVEARLAHGYQSRWQTRTFCDYD